MSDSDADLSLLVALTVLACKMSTIHRMGSLVARNVGIHPLMLVGYKQFS